MSSETLGPVHEQPKNVEQTGYSVEEVLVAGNRGPCGGVNMAFEAANQVLDIVGGREAVYINWDLVNNRPIMDQYRERGIVNVQNDLSAVPDGSILLFSAHGVPPEFHRIAQEKSLLTIDTTCQLVTRVHNLAKNAARDGQHVIYIGAKGHPETVGTMGEVPLGEISLVTNPEEVDDLQVPEEKQKIVYSQTTLSTDEIRETMEALRRKFGEDVKIPNRWDICYATDNRQQAVEQISEISDMLIVVGSKHSHNSQELKRKGERKGIFSVSVDTAEELEDSWFHGPKTVALTSGASVIEKYTMDVVEYFRSRGSKITFMPQVIEEREMTFKLPQESISALERRYIKSN